jgi:hypothetical protein
MTYFWRTTPSKDCRIFVQTMGSTSNSASWVCPSLFVAFIVSDGRVGGRRWEKNAAEGPATMQNLPLCNVVVSSWLNNAQTAE